MQNLRNFFIAFLVGAILFSCGAWFILQKLTIADENVEVGEDTHIQVVEPVISNTPDVIEKEIIGESFTALLAVTDPLTNRHDSLMLLHVDKERHEYMVTSLPSYMVLNMDSLEYYLGDIINEKDTTFLLDKIYAITGLKIDYYAFFSLEGFTSIIDELGGVTFTVPQNMYYEDHEGNVLVDLKRGTKKLKGEAALQLLRFKDYSNGDEERRNIQRDFLFTALDIFLSPTNITKAPSVFEKISEFTETNFTIDDFVANMDLIFNYKSFTKIEIDYPGVSSDSDGVVRFIPKIDEAIETYKNHR